MAINVGHNFVKEIVGLPTYIAGAVLANMSSSNAVGFIAVVLVTIVLYNVVYRLVFPNLEFRERIHDLVALFFGQLALWGAVWLVWR